MDSHPQGMYDVIVAVSPEAYVEPVTMGTLP